MHYLNPNIHPYLPSIQPPFVKSIHNKWQDSRQSIPYGSFKSMEEFNWYTNFTSARFNHNSALYSAGHATLDIAKAKKIESMLDRRPRSETFLLADSGGYQVGVEKWSYADIDKLLPEVVNWQMEFADVGVILDLPSWGTINGKEIDGEFALRETNKNLKKTAQIVSESGKDFPFINVLQGNSIEACKKWFDETRWFNDEGYGVGWCFPGMLACNFHAALTMLLYMWDQKHYPRYIHFLGLGTVGAGGLMYTLRRTIARAYASMGIAKDSRQEAAITITMDSSSEFISTGRYGNIYVRPKLSDPKKASLSPYTVETTDFQSEVDFIKHDQFYPNVEGPVLGSPKGVKFGDLINPHMPEGSKSSYNMDEISYNILWAHNVWVKQAAIEKCKNTERLLRRLHYGKHKPENYELADTVERFFLFMQSHTEAEKYGEMSKDLVTVTVGLWDLFVDQFDPNYTSKERLKVLDTFKSQALNIFRRNEDES